MRSRGPDVELGFLKAVAFSGPLLLFIAWQLYSVNKELEDEKKPSSGDDENSD